MFFPAKMGDFTNSDVIEHHGLGGLFRHLGPSSIEETIKMVGFKWEGPSGGELNIHEFTNWNRFFRFLLAYFESTWIWSFECFWHITNRELCRSSWVDCLRGCTRGVEYWTQNWNRTRNRLSARVYCDGINQPPCPVLSAGIVAEVESCRSIDRWEWCLGDGWFV